MSNVNYVNRRDIVTEFNQQYFCLCLLHSCLKQQKISGEPFLYCTQTKTLWCLLLTKIENELGARKRFKSSPLFSEAHDHKLTNLKCKLICLKKILY